MTDPALATVYEELRKIHEARVKAKVELWFDPPQKPKVLVTHDVRDGEKIYHTLENSSVR
jgi:hypothetical protein